MTPSTYFGLLAEFGTAHEVVRNINASLQNRGSGLRGKKSHCAVKRRTIN
jgi:hypothetical protein